MTTPQRTLQQHGLTSHQRTQIFHLEEEGWKFVRVKRLHDSGNPVASIVMRNPHGQQQTVGAAESQRVSDELRRDG